MSIHKGPYVGLLNEIPLVGMYYYRILLDYLEKYTMEHNSEYVAKLVTPSAVWNIYISNNINSDGYWGRICFNTKNYKDLSEVRLIVIWDKKEMGIFSTIHVERKTYKLINFKQFLPELYEIFQGIELQNPELIEMIYPELSEMIYG